MGGKSPFAPRSPKRAAFGGFVAVLGSLTKNKIKRRFLSKIGKVFVGEGASSRNCRFGPLFAKRCPVREIFFHHDIHFNG